MNDMINLNIRCLLAFMMVAVLGYGNPSIAANDPLPPDPDFVVTFPVGLACGFELQVEGWNGKQHFKEFKDKNGIVRTLSAGTGSALRYTNVTNGKTFSSKSNGAVNHTTYNLDGSSTLNSRDTTSSYSFRPTSLQGPRRHSIQVVLSSQSTATATSPCNRKAETRPTSVPPCNDLNLQNGARVTLATISG